MPDGRRAYHLRQTSSRDDVAGVYEAVQVARALLYLLPHVVVAVEVEDVGNEIKGILIVLDFGVQPRQVEAIGEVLFVDFAEVLVAARGYELFQMVSKKGQGSM